LTWVGSHDNLPNILTTVRVLHGLTQGTTLGRSVGGAMTLSVLAHYITTGDVIDPDMSSEESRMFIASAMLDVLTDSTEAGISALLGRLTILRGQDWLGAEARERVRTITGMTDLIPQYRAFRQHFLSEGEFAGWETASVEQRRQIEAIASFARSVILANAFDRPLRYSAGFRAAESTYQAMHQADIEAGRLSDFCATLETALRQLRGDRGLPPNYLDDCRLASSLVDRSADDSVRETLRRDLLSAGGRRELQAGIEEESVDANMRVEWLVQQGDDANGGRIGEVLAVMLPQVHHTAPDTVTIDAAPFIVGLNTLIDSQSARRREYLLAALAVVRRFFPESGGYSTVRGFVDGEFRELNWAVSDEDRQLLRQFLRSLESRLGSSQEHSDILLPVLESAICAVGAAGLLSSHLIPEVGESPDLQLGLGTTSATLAGAGCTALIGHYLWPAITNDVHNRYVWEGLTGLGGGLVAGGLYFLLSFLLRGEGSGPGIGIRFPVDPYGP
ncbi:MAG TPA: hypothetical protein VFW62_12060, partial [bacterium]|nr:hypothetical protein [bacterium]